MSNRFSLIVPYEPYLACVSKLRGSVSVYCSGLAVFFFECWFAGSFIIIMRFTVKKLLRHCRKT